MERGQEDRPGEFSMPLATVPGATLVQQRKKGRLNVVCLDHDKSPPPNLRDVWNKERSF